MLVLYMFVIYNVCLPCGELVHNTSFFFFVFPTGSPGSMVSCDTDHTVFSASQVLGVEPAWHTQDGAPDAMLCLNRGTLVC